MPGLDLTITTVYFHNVPVGQITCTLKPSERKGKAKLYYMLMGVLPASRWVPQLLLSFADTSPNLSSHTSHLASAPTRAK